MNNTSTNTDIECVIKKDFLMKRAQLKSFFTIENYKYRWFELTKTVLRYSDGSEENGIGKLKGQVLLRSVKNVEEADQEGLGGRPYGFQVVYKLADERNILYIVTNNEEQRKFWIDTLTDTCIQSGASFSLMYHPGVWQKTGKYSCCYSINKFSEGCQKIAQRDHPGSAKFFDGLKQRRGSCGDLLTIPLPKTPTIATTPTTAPTTNKKIFSKNSNKKPSKKSFSPNHTTTTSNNNSSSSTNFTTRTATTTNSNVAGAKNSDATSTKAAVATTTTTKLAECRKFAVRSAPADRRSQSSDRVQTRPDIYPRVLALFNYQAMQKDDLDLVKGEEYDVIDLIDEQSSWWLMRNSSGKTGYAPANYVQQVTGECLDQYDWFYPKLSRYQSEELLRADGREGVFLVRESSQFGMYTLSLYTKAERDEQVMHYLIKRNSRDLYYVTNQHTFSTIPELIYYHRHNCAGLIVRLKVPAGDKSQYKPACGLGYDLKQIDINSIEILEQLGKGQYGIVNRGMYLGKIEVAIKTMTIGALEDDFIEEAFTMTNLQHDNLVKLYGVCTKTSPIRIVTEYLKNGSLLLYLQKHKQRFIFNVDSLVEMCIEVARGMTYLEQNKVIHRDLAARNCLVDEKGLVKVGDFGLARYVLDNEYISSKGTKFPVRWASPEIIMHSMFSSKSDVWAYGVLVWEIFTCGQLPYGPKKNVDIANEISKGSLNLERPPLSCEVTYNIMKSCWKMEPLQRPGFSDLLKRFQALLSRDYDD